MDRALFGRWLADRCDALPAQVASDSYTFADQRNVSEVGDVQVVFGSRSGGLSQLLQKR